MREIIDVTKLHEALEQFLSLPSWGELIWVLAGFIVIMIGHLVVPTAEGAPSRFSSKYIKTIVHFALYIFIYQK